MATPRYRVLRACFMAPFYLYPGSIFESDMLPSDYLEPLNEEAVARKEDWYNKDYSVRDPETGKMTTMKLNAGKRPADLEEVVPAQAVHLISDAPPGLDEGGGMSLAESATVPASRGPQGPPVKTPPVADEPAKTLDGTAEIISAAPEPKKA